MWQLFRLSIRKRLVPQYSQLKEHVWNNTKYCSFSTLDHKDEKPLKDSTSNQPTESLSNPPATETNFVDSEKRPDVPSRSVKSSKFRQVDRSKLIHEYYPELRIKPPFFEYEPDRDRLIYQAPYFQAPLELIRSLSTEEIISALKEYAGFLKGDREILLNRLIFYTRPRPEELIHGKVSSTRMNKSVTVVSRRPCYYKRLKVRTFRFRKFMAHDEFNLCDEGDEVLIRHCRPLSDRKRFVVVENYGKRIPNMANMEELILKAREKLLKETVEFEKQKNVLN
ncbi:hypothetical protein GpartN1_g7645.t1 [Galdieria partita]|uniref:30S ribosomal protein S17 n=1 Tax=Galdieria partita TaxID=83374 RepID=A0A9C7Q3X5_9RHOD|nr:hypothetical protein GpartN1_g7645.t1 [Galdieria partita]